MVRNDVRGRIGMSGAVPNHIIFYKIEVIIN